MVHFLDELKYDFEYEYRLKRLSLTKLQSRRMRGDLIETFKVLSDIRSYHFDLMRQKSGNKNFDDNMTRPMVTKPRNDCNTLEKT